MKGNRILPVSLKTLGHIARYVRGQHSEFFRPMIFRDTEAFLVSEIKLHKQKTPKPLRVAIVGCAAGEEIYSLAMALHGDGLLKDVAFRALDNDPKMVVVAAQGAYCFDDYEGRLDFFEAVPNVCREYFITDSCQGHHFRIDQRIRRAINFQLADAVAPDFKTKVPEQDVFIINNVLVHMGEEEKAAVINNLVDNLAPGGKIIANESIDFPTLHRVKKQGSIYLYEKTN